MVRKRVTKTVQNPPYSKDEETRLIWLYKSGARQKEIIEALFREFGIRRTDSSISGKIDRLGIGRSRICQSTVVQKGSIQYKVDLSIEPAPDDAVKLVNNNQCAYPYGTKGDWSYCGHAVHKKQYCEKHYNLCYRQLEKKAKTF